MFDQKKMAIVIVIFLAVNWVSIFSGNVFVAAAGAMIYVDDDNAAGPWDGTLTNPYQSIQAGINAASDGDTVRVLGGTYIENVVVNKSLTLDGESKPVLAGTGAPDSRGIDITATNVTVNGFNLTNSDYGIYCNASGFSLINNVFWYNEWGFYWRISESSLSQDYTIHRSRIDNNEFYTSSNYTSAIRVWLTLDYGSNSGYDVEVGDIQICGNTFYLEGTDARGIDVYDMWVDDLSGGTVSYGIVNMSANTIYGGSRGISFYGELTYLEDVQASVADVIITNNVLVNQTLYGVVVDYYDGTYFYGDTEVNFGDLRVQGNSVTSLYNSFGIYVRDIGYWNDFYGNARLEVGNLYIEDNEIDVTGSWAGDEAGIYLYGLYVGEYLYGNSSFAMGDILVRNNLVKGYYGISIDLEEFGYGLNGTSSVTMGNIELSGNVINSTMYGIYVYEIYDFGYEMYDDSSFTMGSIRINENVINSGTDGIYLDYIHEIGYYMYGNSALTMGDIELSGNMITTPDWGIYSYEFDYVGYEMYDNASLTMGSIRINENIINSGLEGVFLATIEYFGSNLVGTSAFTMGDIQVNENVINSEYYGIFVDYIAYFGEYMEDHSSFTMGNIEVNGNMINCTYFGLLAEYLAVEFGYFMTGYASFTMGHIQINNNLINQKGESGSGHGGWESGISLQELYYLGYFLYDKSTFSMGNIEVNGNTIDSERYGVTIYEIAYLGHMMYNESSFAMGDFLVNGNTINSSDPGLYLEYIDYFGNGMYGNSSFTMGNVQINGNVIDSSGEGIFIEDLDQFGTYLYGNASFAMDNIEISGNTINSSTYGINIMELYHAYELHDVASFTMGDVLLSGNVIRSGEDGVYLQDNWPKRFGDNAGDAVTIRTGNVELSWNEIVGSRLDLNAGMRLTDLDNATISNNVIRNCSYGLYLQTSANNSIYHNNFLNNTVQAYVTVNSNNSWDDGYPRGGNYWSDYTGIDLYSGPDQTIAGSDSRGDTPYVINANNTDRYPLTTPYETQPPTITVLSPENKTYAVDTDIQLTFILDEPASWMGHSLNDQATVTIDGNTTLPTLPDGRHRITIFANDTFDNLAMSTVSFTVDTTPPIANAGNDQTVTEEMSATLDGSASTDNIGIASYLWTFTDVTGKTLTGDQPVYTFSNPGVFTITLNVTDAVGNWATDIVVVTVLLDTDGDATPDTMDADDDGDSIPDTWETTHGLNPLDAADASLDPDGDGLTNLQEYQGNTDPNNSFSPFPLWMAGIAVFAVAGLAIGVYFLKMKKS